LASDLLKTNALRPLVGAPAITFSRLNHQLNYSVSIFLFQGLGSPSWAAVSELSLLGVHQHKLPFEIRGLKDMLGRGGTYNKQRQNCAKTNACTDLYILVDTSIYLSANP
jgi:hypothetical protein